MVNLQEKIIWPDRVSDPVPLDAQPDALSTGLCGFALEILDECKVKAKMII